MSNNYHYKKSYTGWWIAGSIVLAVLGLVLLGKYNPQSKRTNREVALACTTDMATRFHIHPHLEIIANGESQEIPANIGIILTCMHPLHTHDTSGTLHVESPTLRDFTLADFFAVWNQPFDKNQVLGYKIDNKHIIKVTVNGVAVDTYEQTILRDRDQIVISYEKKN